MFINAEVTEGTWTARWSAILFCYEPEYRTVARLSSTIRLRGSA
jgi:hypothetical protein